MRIVRVFLGLVIILGALSVAPASAQDAVADHQYFSDTGHNVKGEFWQYYQNLPNRTTLLGYPITEDFENVDGKHVQYFQRGRLELADEVVRPTPLGSLLYEPGIKLDFNNSISCEMFSQTGQERYPVCFSFLKYFKENGGLGFFGYPISSFEYQDNSIVQYFQNGRMEWRPSNPDGQQVVMTDLGSSYFYLAGEDPALLQAVPPLSRAPETIKVTALNVRAFPWKSVVYSTDEQMIFVVVQDQTLKPIKGVNGEATVLWTDGTQESFKILTGDSGISTLALKVKDQEYGGLVTIDVQIVYEGVSGHTTTSFRIWY